MLPLTLSKHHGLGNDFLVLIDLDERVDANAAPALARAVCDRHRGIGADGLLIARSPAGRDAADLAMRLHNADGGIAEMSGNGIRCFAQAVVTAGLVAAGTVRIATDGGLRVVDVGPTDPCGRAEVRVGMGAAIVGTVDVPDATRVVLSNARFVTVDMGNPHLVVDRSLADDPTAIAMLGPELEAPFLGEPTRGINVEAIWLDGPDTVQMRVWERGVGVTEACGTGACAAAVAAMGWGWVGDRVTVVQPGGAAVVEVGAGEITLVGPTQHIADIFWPRQG